MDQQAKKKKKTERETGLGRRTIDEKAKWNQIEEAEEEVWKHDFGLRRENNRDLK